MKLRTKIIKHREKENSGSSGGGKRKAEACAPTSQPRPLQRARCGLNAEQKDAEIQQGATGPAAAEDDAQAALLQRVALAFGGEQCDRQCLPARQQQQQEQQHLPPVVPPETSPAPALHIVCSGEEAQWLDVMRLPPLVDLRALPAGLEAPGYGWPSGTGTPRLVGVPRTPAGLIFVPLGTPLSQHRPLPTPAFLDFGGPAVPPTQDHWRNRQHPPSPCVGGAADATATPQGHPAGGSVVVAQASAAPADILVPNAARRQQCVPRISELLASLPIYSPSRSAPSAAAAAGLPAGAAPRLRAVLPASASRTQLQQQRSPSPDSQAREPSRRARRQRAQSSEFHWSEYGEEEEEEEEGGGGALMLAAGTDDDTPVSCATSASQSTGSGRKQRPAASQSTSSSKKSRPAASQLQQHMQQGALLRQLQSLLHLPAPQAAAAMGATKPNFCTLCRSVGIQRWPSHRPR